MSPYSITVPETARALTIEAKFNKALPKIRAVLRFSMLK